MLPFGNISERIFTHTASHYACKHTTILAVWQERKCRLRTARAKGDILFHEREYPPFEPPRERFTLPALGLKNCTACGIGCLPWDGSTRLGLLLSSLSLCLRFVTLTQFPSTTDFHCFVFVCRGGLAGTRCNMEADGGRKLVRTSTSWAERQRIIEVGQIV